jgi:BirA family biotin operon repressor/biotin-[acetyl-CoA-carboxylase] ligase
VAKQLAEENLVMNGYVITTDFQSKGRGQEQSGWESERGQNIIASVILHPNLAVDKQLYLNISVCLAVYDFVKMYCPDEEVSIKWPNDIYVNDRKISGILIENSVQGTAIKHSIIGIGININQELYHTPKAISLRQVTGMEYKVDDLIKNLLLHLEYRYQQLLAGVYDDLWHQYHEFLYRKNEPTQFKTATEKFEGIPKGIDSAGRLQVLVGNEVKVFNVKEIAWK